MKFFSRHVSIEVSNAGEILRGTRGKTHSPFTFANEASTSPQHELTANHRPLAESTKTHMQELTLFTMITFSGG